MGSFSFSFVVKVCYIFKMTETEIRNYMSIKYLQQMVDELKGQGKMVFYEPTTQEKIDVFEKGNNFTFPTKYKEWLLLSDGGELFLPAGVQLYGVEYKPTIITEDNIIPNNNYIIIGMLTSGDLVLCEKNEEKVSVYNPEVGRFEDGAIYDDFVAFLNDLYDLLDMKFYEEI